LLLVTLTPKPVALTLKPVNFESFQVCTYRAENLAQPVPFLLNAQVWSPRAAEYWIKPALVLSLMLMVSPRPLLSK
jgi:hypothetical protein